MFWFFLVSYWEHDLFHAYAAHPFESNNLAFMTCIKTFKCLKIITITTTTIIIVSAIGRMNIQVTRHQGEPLTMIPGDPLIKILDRWINKLFPLKYGMFTVNFVTYPHSCPSVGEEPTVPRQWWLWRGWRRWQEEAPLGILNTSFNVGERKLIS